MTATDWLAQLAAPGGAAKTILEQTYGGDSGVIAARVALIRSVVARFRERFGAVPVRVFRSPGRINLRGMHVDTHGGYLNLMTHQREVIIAVTVSDTDEVTISNCDQSFSEVSFRIGEQSGHPAFLGEWRAFITHPEIAGPVQERRGYWGNYLRGAALRAQRAFPSTPLRGIRGVVGSDVPRGAALSSSAALLVAFQSALLGANERRFSDREAILAVRDSEWYAGSRIGVSDQAAMLLGGTNALVNVALRADRLDTASARRVEFPDGLSVLVINSYTERSLSGAHLVEYTRNRFAYSLALDIFRQEMRAAGFSEEVADGMDSLAAVTAEAFAAHGGVGTLYRLIGRIPERAPLGELKQRYHLPTFDRAYQDFFGAVPAEARPSTIDLRGPLLYGVAESERARLFPDALEDGDYVRAGRLMSVGHNGDRRLTGAGQPYRYDVGDGVLCDLATQETPIEWCPGVYGASSPVLDALVDEAVEAGALGACLTGAGIAGAVIALCNASDSEGIAEAVRKRMAQADYMSLAHRATPLTDEELTNAVVVNHATARAGELKI